MAKVYECEFCSYETKNISNYKRHINSKRHQYKIALNSKNNIIYTYSNGTNKCEYCNEVFSRTDSLRRHRKSCTSHLIKQKEEIIKNTIEQIKSQEEGLVKKNEEIKYYKQLLELNGNKEYQYEGKYLVPNKIIPLMKLMY